MDKLLRDKRAILILIGPAFILYFFTVIFPISMSGIYSTYEWDGIGEQIFIGFNNYLHLFHDQGFLHSVVNTIILSLLTVFIQIPIALTLALVLSSGIRAEVSFRTLYFIPVILPSTVIGLLWKRIYDPNYGLLNAVLRFFGGSDLIHYWLGDLSTVLVAVSIPIIWQWVGYHMLLLYAAAKGVSTDIREAAEIDGASRFQTAVRVVLPQMYPILRVCITLAIVGSMKHFDLVYVMTKGGPAHASEMPSTLMFSTIFSRNNYGYGSAMALFIVVECLLLTILLQKILKTDKGLA